MIRSLELIYLYKSYYFADFFQNKLHYLKLQQQSDSLMSQKTMTLDEFHETHHTLLSIEDTLVKSSMIESLSSSQQTHLCSTVEEVIMERPGMSKDELRLSFYQYTSEELDNTVSSVRFYIKVISVIYS
jgi:hypothetical protein